MRLSRALLTNVRHNLKTKPIIVGTNELTIELDSSTVATVSFVKLDHQTYDLVHTLIPEQLQGQGLGHIFAQVCSLWHKSEKYQDLCYYSGFSIIY